MAESHSQDISIDTQQWNDALNHVNLGGEPKANTPSLLAIPIELRNNIYSYLLGAYQPGEIVIDDLGDLLSWYDFSVLQINQQIRAEAWDYLIRSNIWILVTFPIGQAPSTLPSHMSMSHHPLMYETWQSQPHFPYYKAPSEYAQQLVRGAAASIWLNNAGHTTQDTISDTQRAHRTVMFAYKPSRYGIFIQQLLNFTTVYTWNKLKGFVVKASPIVQPGSAEFRKLIEPLRALRGLEGVEFHGVANCPALRDLSRQIRHRFNSIEELLTIQKFYWHQGREAELGGCYSDAICHYQTGVGDMYQKEYTWTFHMLRRLRGELLEGSPEYNSLFHIRLDTYIGLSRCAHKYLLQLKNVSASYHLQAASVIERSITWARQACQFAGMTQPQLREVHLYTAFALQYKAELMNCRPDDKAFGERICRSRHYIYSPEDFDEGFDKACENASKHLFFAKKIDPAYDVLEGLDEEDKATYLKIREPPAEGFEFLEREIPLMGTWRVDPQVWTWWIEEGGCHWMKKLLARRHVVDSGRAETEDESEIAAQYAAEGISWNFGFRSRIWGQLHFFDFESENPDHEYHILGED
ncbi:hypothetical protein PG995_013173 [Apiospora arundinis]